MATAKASADPAVWSGLQPLPAMSEADFLQWTELLRERTGMHMPKERKSFLATSVGLRMRELGYRDYRSYYEFVTSGLAGNVEWAALVDRLTVNETRFFRDPRSLELVVEQCLPRMAERIRAGGQAHIWSAGCATGEEAFTLAMLADDYFRRCGVPLRYGVTGSDISLHSLATARQALYPKRRYEQIPPELRSRYTEQLPDGKFRIVDSLRWRACFAQFNILHAASAPPRSMDLIYCQNVLIYFDQPTRRKILDGLVQPLREGGVLILGAGEVIGWEHPLMTRTGSLDVLAFQRTT